MRLFKTTLALPSLIFFALTTVSVFLAPLPTSADEISFSETYIEQLVEGEVIWQGSSTFEIVLPWNGVNLEQINGNTEINISIGELQFNRILDGSEDYEEGARSATFRDKDVNNSGTEVDRLFVDVSWNTKTFTIFGTYRNFSNASESEFIDAPNHLQVAGQFQGALSASIAFGSFTTNYPVAFSGSTARTRRVVDEEELFLNNVQLSGRADLPPNDTIRPSVSITSPAANGRLLTPVITGKAGDNSAVAEVFYRIGTDEFALANGTTNWSVSLPLLPPGTNVAEVKSIDRAGNESPVLRRTFFYVVTSPLTVELNPEWGSTTLTNGQLLELARSYSITANPAPGYVFQDWSGSVNSQSNTISFLMEPGFLLQPNFVTNPFIPVKGVYSGLFSNTNGVAPASAGFFTVTVEDSGAFSGKLLLAGAQYSISGQFGLSGIADKTSVTGSDSVILHLKLNFDGSLSGTLTRNQVNSELVAELALTMTNSANAKYTLLIPPSIDPSTAPGGYGFGVATVDRQGTLRFKGTLSDGTQVSQMTTVSTNGRWPLYVSLYRGQGVLSGWMSFTNGADSDVRGDVAWAKLPGVRGKLHTNGFSIMGPAIGSLYLPPPLGTTVLTSTGPIFGSLEFIAGNLSVPLTNAFVLNTNNKLTISSSNKTTLSVTRSSGLLNGRFVHPKTRRSASLKGVVLQKSKWGGGFFLGTNQSGAFFLQPDP